MAAFVVTPFLLASTLSNVRLDLDNRLSREDLIASRCGVCPLAMHANACADRHFLKLSHKHEVDADINESEISIFGERKKRVDKYLREHPVVTGIAKDPSSGQAAADDAPEATEAAETAREREHGFETLNW